MPWGFARSGSSEKVQGAGAISGTEWGGCPSSSDGSQLISQLFLAVLAAGQSKAQVALEEVPTSLSLFGRSAASLPCLCYHLEGTFYSGFQIQLNCHICFSWVSTSGMCLKQKARNHINDVLDINV